ncbi:hypothetical protein D3C78_1516870 [compost metagenome]
MLRKYRRHEMNIQMYDRQGILGQIVEELGEQDIQIFELMVQSHNKLEGQFETIIVRLSVKLPRGNKIVNAINKIYNYDDVLSIEISNLFNLSKKLN